MLTELQIMAIANANRATAMLLHKDAAFTQELSGKAQDTGRTGFCVAYKETQNQFGAVGLHNAYVHASGPGGSGIIGMWYNTPHFYFDSVRAYASRAAAMKAAVENGQIGIYDLASETYVPTPDAEGTLAQVTHPHVPGPAPVARPPLTRRHSFIR